MLELERNIGAAILNSTAAHGEKTAFEMHSGALSYANLGRMVYGVTNLLHTHGVGRGSCAAILIEDPAGALICMAACSLLGASWVDGKPRSFKAVADHVTHSLAPNELPAKIPTAGKVIVISPKMISNSGSTDGFTQHEPEGFESGSSVSRIGISSGSTGEQKAICISADGEWNRANWRPETIRLPSSPTCLCLFPPKTGIGSNTRMQVLLSGGTCMETVSADILQAGKIDMVVGSPAQLANYTDRLAKSGSSAKVSHAVIGGSHLGPEFLNLMRERFDSICNLYGSTEMGIMAEYCSVERKDYDGRVRPRRNVRIEVVGHNDEPVPAGTQGFIRVKTDSGLPRYFDEQAQAKAVRDGWFYSGDMGTMSPDGFLFVEGRNDDTVNLGGVKVNILLYDDLIGHFEGIEDGYAFLKADEYGVNKLNIVAQFKSDEDTIARAKELMANIESAPKLTVQPVAIYSVDQIPRTETGKPQRHAVSKILENAQPTLFYVKAP